MWGDEQDGRELETVETGVRPVIDPVTGEVEEEELNPPPPDPSAIDINTMSAEEFMRLADWQWETVLKQIVAELGAVQRQRVTLAPAYYEYQGLKEKERNLTSMKSAVQSLLRTARET